SQKWSSFCADTDACCFEAVLGFTVVCIQRRRNQGREAVKIVLHAGFPKTGSSTLQRYFGSHILGLSQNGIFYPKFDKFPSHWALTAAFHDSPENYHHVQRRIATGDVSNQLNVTKRKLCSLLA